MKAFTTLVTALLIATLAGAAYLYLYTYQPMVTAYARLQAGQPEFQMARRELATFKAREKQDTGWIDPAAAAAKKLLETEIGAGKAEVVVAGNRLVVNVAEDVLYTPKSVTFAKSSPQSLANLAALIRYLKGKEFLVGNMTEPAPAHGRGRKRVPARDARSLASARSLELVKYFERNGVSSDVLVAAAYPEKVQDQGFKIKSGKTVIVISQPVAVARAATAPAPVTRPVPTPKPATAAPAAQQPRAQQKPIPISPAPPKQTP